MEPSPHDNSNRGFLDRNPAVLILIPALALLLGQALVKVVFVSVASALGIGVTAIVLFGMLLWKKRAQWGLLALFSCAAFLAGYFMHEKVIHPEFSENHLRAIATDKDSLYIEAVHY
ncbi:MAG: hypothetical protein ACREQK_19980, partial [Candidatus Binatia bacterium]